MILGQRARLELHIEQREWMPDTFDEVNELFHKWRLALSPQETGWVLAVDGLGRVPLAGSPPKASI